MYVVVDDGRCADVHLVKKVETGELCAIKIITPHEDYGIVDLVAIDIMTRLRHPYLLKAIKVISAKEIIPDSSNKLAIILPLGKVTLRSLIDGQALAWTSSSHFLGDGEKECAEIMWRLSTSLAFLHRHHVLHLDIRPENIICRGHDDTFRPLLADFSQAQYGEEIIINNIPPTNLRYYPPEVLSYPPSPYTQKGDVWSLGVVFFEMLTGQPLFKCNNQQEIVEEIDFIRHPNDRLCYLASVIPSQFTNAIDLLFRMLDPNPLTRIETADICIAGFFSSRIDYILPEGGFLPTGDEGIRQDLPLEAIYNSLPVVISD